MKLVRKSPKCVSLIFRISSTFHKSVRSIEGSDFVLRSGVDVHWLGGEPSWQRSLNLRGKRQTASLWPSASTSEQETRICKEKNVTLSELFSSYRAKRERDDCQWGRSQVEHSHQKRKQGVARARAGRTGLRAILRNGSRLSLLAVAWQLIRNRLKRWRDRITHRHRL